MRDAEDEVEKIVSSKKRKRDKVAKKRKSEKEKKSDDSSSDSKQDNKPAANVAVPSKKQPAKNGALSIPEEKGQPATSSSSSEALDDDSNDDEAPQPEEGSPGAKNEASDTKREVQSSEGFSDSSSESDSNKTSDEDNPVKDSESLDDSEEEIEEKYPTAPLESDKDVEMVDAGSLGKEAPKSPTTLKDQHAMLKTICVRNLSYSVERADMEILFKECGEIVGVRLHTDNEGRFKGFGHVEFATAEAAQKALRFDNTELLRRTIHVDLARQKDECTRNSSNLSNSIEKCETVRYQTVYVKGFDTSLTRSKITASLEEHFRSCGEITRISIPKYRGTIKGFAHLDFKDVDSLKKALQLHKTELGGFPLSVEKAKPRHDYHGLGSDRAGGGHQFAGRYRDGYDSGRAGGGHQFGGRYRDGYDSGHQFGGRYRDGYDSGRAGGGHQFAGRYRDGYDSGGRQRSGSHGWR